MEFMPLYLFAFTCVVLLLGYPVALSLAGSALLFAGIGIATGQFDAVSFLAISGRLFGIVSNQTLIAVPLFVFMGLMLERARIADGLLKSMAELFGPLRGGLGISVMLVGMLLAASTGIVGATVVTMGLLSLPTMLQSGYDKRLATGAICASGTLGQIIPPSIVLVLLGDVISSAYRESQSMLGKFPDQSVSVGDLFIGALIPGILLVLLYIVYIALVAWLKPDAAPAMPKVQGRSYGKICREALQNMVFPLGLIVCVLGSILTGMATPTEAAAVGAVGALCLAVAKRQFSLQLLQEVMRGTTQTTCMVFLILIGASIFSLVFRGFGGDELIQSLFEDMPGGKYTALFIVMLVMFLLGFILDFIEITFVVVPIVGPIILAMGFDPVWLGIMIAMNLQTSFLTPPFGFALFYLRGVAPKKIPTKAIYRGVAPFIVIQLVVLLILVLFPELATWLPTQISY